MNYLDHGDWHKDLLRIMAQRMRPTCFIELGLGGTPSIHSVSEHCGVAYGVDRYKSPCEAPPNRILVEMTTDQFFADVAPGIPPPELVFIDADHSKESVLRDLANVAAICADNCVVVLHDTFPPGINHTAPDFCGDAYLVPGMIEWEHVTLPFPPGVTICRLKPRSLCE